MGEHRALWEPQGGPSGPIGEVREVCREEGAYFELCRAFWGKAGKEGEGKAVVSREVSAEESVAQINFRVPHRQGFV